MSERAKLCIVAATAVFLAVCAVAIWADAKAERECRDSGRRWEIDHYYTRWTTMGKNEIPVPIQTPVYGCH